MLSVVLLLWCAYLVNYKTKQIYQKSALFLLLLINLNYMLQLSPYLIQCLHTMIDHVLKLDYNSAFYIHTQLVSGPEFSKISTFMPSLKALFQMTYQYNIRFEGLC